ncbi:MAG: hypothetical protein JXQ23_12740 [Clostridia bacterium]|nr:hypothetical protein [Clostridia bacterium]
MKKAAIFTAGIIIFTILAGFNYLLWDNMAKKEKLNESELIKSENLQSIQSLIDTLNDKDDTIRSIREARDALQNEINTFDEILASKNAELNDKDAQLQDIYEEINNHYLIIDALKQAVGSTYFINFLTVNWAIPISAQTLSTPFLYQDSKIVLGETTDESYSTFRQQFENVVNIEVTNADKVESTKSDVNQLEYLEFKVQLNITLAKNEEGLPVEDENFVEGVNVFFFTFKYDTTKSTWLITSMK